MFTAEDQVNKAAARQLNEVSRGEEGGGRGVGGGHTGPNEHKMSNANIKNLNEMAARKHGR